MLSWDSRPLKGESGGSVSAGRRIGASAYRRVGVSAYRVTGADPPTRRYVSPDTPLNCPDEHGTFACFEAAQKYLVCLHGERLPESDGRGTIPPNVGEPP
jgi:hypothetical protein